MSPLDKNSLKSKIARIRRNVKELKKLATLPLDTYIRDFRNTTLAERLIHVTIEAMLDIGSHIIAEESLGEPLEYRDIFVILTKAGILPKKLEKQFVSLAGLRNRIVHLYDEIDHELLHKAMQTEIDDFEIFTEVVLKFLNRKSK